MRKFAFEQDAAFTLVHSADLHLGSGMAVAKRLGREDDLQGVTYEALQNLVSLCQERGAQILTLGGDLFDHSDQPNPVPRRRLREALENIPETIVAVARGNHDHLDSRFPQISYPDNVFEFHGKAKTCDVGWVQLHGISYSTQHVRESLLPRYPPASQDHFDIGLLHANVGNNPAHLPYAPCTVDDLVTHGYDMWLLGHIHKRQVLSEDPLIIYPGNLQGRDAGETGPRTAEVIDVDEAGRVTHEPVPVHTMLWLEHEVDVSECEDADQVLDLVVKEAKRLLDGLGQEKGLILRIDLVGNTELHESLARTPATHNDSIAYAIQEHINETLGEQDPLVLVDRVRIRTRSTFDLDELARGEHVLGVLVRLARRKETREEAVQVLQQGALEEQEAEKLVDLLWEDALQGALARIRGREA